MTLNPLRDDVRHFMPTTSTYKDNLGLRIDKLNHQVIEDGDNAEAKQIALDILTSFRLDDSAIKLYSNSYDRWLKTMQSREDTECFEIKSTTKVLLGTGNASVFEFGTNLSKPFGMPHISGSSLKGLVSAYLSKNSSEWWKSNSNTEKSEYQVQLFGGRYDGKDYIGSVNFYDARITPGQQTWFVSDIITTHHQKYYGGNRLPDGTENPIPIKIAALDIGLKFGVVIQGDESERQFVKKVLLEALAQDGIGGKTAVGYGRFEGILSQNEKYDAIRNYSTDVLIKLGTGDKLGKDEKNDNAIRHALESNPIISELENKYKKYCPLRFIRLNIQNANAPSLELISLDRQTKKNLAKYKNYNKSEDARFLFNYGITNLKLDTESLENHPVLSKCAYSWNEVDINKDNIETIIDELESRPWPPGADLTEWLVKSQLQNKEEMLELLEMVLEDL